MYRPVEPDPVNTGVGIEELIKPHPSLILRHRQKSCFMLRKFMISISFLMFACTLRAETLTIYTYDSFTSDWGPGPLITEAFEQECNCEIEWRSGVDAAALLSLLKLEGENSKADVILGLDTNLMAEAVDSGLVLPHGIEANYTLPMDWDNPHFVPYDYGYFALMYDSEALPNPPQSMEELVAGGTERDLIIQDPRTSSPGLGFVFWLRSLYGEDTPEAWSRLSSRILTVTPGWGEAYGMFTNGEAPMVMSYTTSQSYHEVVEETSRYKALIFPEGHYMQVEVAGIGSYSDQSELARDFLNFLISEKAQQFIPTTNWMYPVVDVGESVPEAMKALEQPEISFLLDPQKADEVREVWIAEWLSSMN